MQKPDMTPLKNTGDSFSCPFFLNSLLPILCAAVLVSCDSGTYRTDKRLVIGVETGPSVLDPRFATDAVSTHICRLIYSGIMKRDKNSELVTDLAEKIEQPDDRTYIVRLKRGVRFHSGASLTARDVLYTFKSIMDKKNSSPKRGALEKVESIKSPNDFTVIIKLSETFAPFPGNLTIGIVPYSLDNTPKRVPSGTGPFRFTKYRKDEKLELSAFSDYFGGEPTISGVDFRIIPDETVRILELVRGNLDILINPITPALLPWLEKQEGLRIETSPGTNASYIGFNLRDPILKNRKVRLALAHAIDRATIIKHLLKGLAIESTSILSSGNPFFNEKIPQITFNPDLSRKLLDEAGYPESENGGPRIVLTYKTSKNPTRRKIAEIFARQFKKIGVSIKIQSTEWGKFYSDIKNGNFQIFSLTWVGIGDPDIYNYIFSSKSVPPEGANRGYFINEELDKLLIKGRKELRFNVRKIYYDRVQEIAARELPYINLWIPVNIAILRKRVNNFIIYPDDGFDSISRVTLKNQYD